MFTFAWKAVLEQGRERGMLAALLVFPVGLLGIYWLAFGQAAGGMAQMLRVVVVNHDAGGRGQGVLEAIRAARFEGQPVFRVTLASSEAVGAVRVREGRATALVVIPSNYSAGLTDTGGAPAPLVVVGDPASDYRTYAVAYLDDIAAEYASSATGKAPRVRFESRFLTGTGTRNDFQAGVPGILVFGTLFLIVSCSTALVREQRGGTLTRMRLSGVRARELLLGTVAAQLGLGLAQTGITAAGGALMGFHYRGSPALALLTLVLCELAAIGVGLLVAACAGGEAQAMSLATLAMVPLAFLSGALFPMPPLVLARFGSHAWQPYDLLPTAHATEILRRLLLLNRGAGEVQGELCVLLLLSALFLAAGTVAYGRRRWARAE